MNALERFDAEREGDETWRDAELIKAVNAGKPLGSEARGRIAEWYAAARADPGASEGLRADVQRWYDEEPRTYSKVDGAAYGYDVARRELELILEGTWYDDGAASPSSDTRPGLREAISVLENYGDHHEWCIRADGDAAACNCGLWDQLERLRAALAAESSEGETP